MTRTSVTEHRQAVHDLCQGVLESPHGPGIESMPIHPKPGQPGARGRILAHDVRAVVDTPAQPNSQMDGFAVRVADLPPTSGTRIRLSVGPMIAAGEPPGTLEPQQLRPIMTGACIPTGADAIIPVESTPFQSFQQQPAARTGQHVIHDGHVVTSLELDVTPEMLTVGRFVRATGSDTRRGDVVARTGTTLTPRHIGLLASVGITHVDVREQPRVIVVSTGRELRESPDPTTPSHHASPPVDDTGVFDANAPALSATLAEMGMNVVAHLRVGDDPHALHTEVTHACLRTRAHIVISSGGVSAGAMEPVRQLATERNNVRLAFHKVAMQPGGPQGLGILTLPGTSERPPADIAWIALPGNPVSALVSIEMFVRPAIGAPPRPTLRLPIRTQTGDSETSPNGLLQVRRARIQHDSTARLVGGPSSHLLGALALSDALVLIPPHVSTIHDRDEHEVMILP